MMDQKPTTWAVKWAMMGTVLAENGLYICCSRQDKYIESWGAHLSQIPHHHSGGVHILQASANVNAKLNCYLS